MKYTKIRKTKIQIVKTNSLTAYTALTLLWRYASIMCKLLFGFVCTDGGWKLTYK